jgi:hypothetical protein
MESELGRSPWHGNVTRYPELYDLLHDDHKSDIALYQRMSQGCDAVLECGVGTGRIAIPLARQGIVVHGIDTSREMLAALERKLQGEADPVRGRVHLHQADMCSFDLGISFKFIYIPFMTFNYLPSIEAQLACLGSISSHLKTEGALVLELISFYREWFHDDGIPRLVVRRTNPDTGATVEVFRVTRFDSSTQTLEHERYYRFVDPTGRVEGERTILLRNRFFFLGEARLLLEKANLTLKQVFGDHDGGPYTRDSQVMILVASKAGA